MAKREYPRRTRALRFGQLMLLSSALTNTPLCLAEFSSDALDPGKTAATELDQRALLLYLGEFDPELDPVELDQIGDALAGTQENNTDTKTAAGTSAHAANEPKN